MLGRSPPLPWMEQSLLRDGYPILSLFATLSSPSNSVDTDVFRNEVWPPGGVAPLTRKPAPSPCPGELAQLSSPMSRTPLLLPGDDRGTEDPRTSAIPDATLLVYVCVRVCVCACLRVRMGSMRLYLSLFEERLCGSPDVGPPPTESVRQPLQPMHCVAGHDVLHV